MKKIIMFAMLSVLTSCAMFAQPPAHPFKHGTEVPKPMGCTGAQSC